MKKIFIITAVSFFFASPVYAATLTVYPDPGTGATTVDGRIYYGNAVPQSWATVHDSANSGPNGAITPATDPNAILGYQYAVTGLFQIDERFFALFDTSPLTAGATISAATLSLFGEATNTSDDSGGAVAVAANIYSSSPASNNNLVTGDYSQVGTTAYSTNIAYASWSTTAYNDFVFNASGLAAISKTSISKFSARDAVYDVANSPPPTAAGSFTSMGSNTADASGTANDPKLVITYSLPSTQNQQPYLMW